MRLVTPHRAHNTLRLSSVVCPGKLLQLLVLLLPALDVAKVGLPDFHVCIQAIYQHAATGREQN